MSVPVIAVDGPTASGKGAVAQRVAERLKFHYLDSGALYRLLAFVAQQTAVPLDDESRLSQLTDSLLFVCRKARFWWDGVDITDALRTESIGQAASQLAAWPEVRQRLLGRQRASRVKPGLVADGRDMGSIVFPEAQTKIFLTARTDIRAKRRHQQLIDQGINVSLGDVFDDLNARDQRDADRPIAPLRQLVDAVLVDTSALTIEAAAEQVVALFLRHCRALPV